MGRLLARMVGFGLQRLYRELSWAYDAVSWIASLGRWGAWRLVALRYLLPGRVLEVGCGTGHLLIPLACGGHRVHGGDLSRPMLRRARRRVRRSGLEIPLCQVQAQALPFRSAAFDSVVCTFPAEYIGDGRTWAEFERVLRPGGRAVVVYGASVGGKGWRRWLGRFLLTLGRTVGAPVRPAWTDRSRLQARHLLVEEGEDRVGLLIAERGDGGDAG